MSFAYYPGCSQTSSAEEYGDSTLVVCNALGITLHEIPDWSCCGASSAHMTNELLSVSLPARDLAAAAGMGMDILVVCAACYSRLKTAQSRILGDEALAREVAGIIGADPRFEGRVRHLLDVVVNDVGFEEMKRWKRVELEGLKAVPYYGCLLVRPPDVCFSESVENPTEMDRLLAFLGVDVRKWSYKTDCCGGSLSLSRTDIVEKMVNGLFERAEEAGANCIVTACPMCTANLEMRQVPSKFSYDVLHRVPVIYFTEMLGLALGMEDARKWLKSHLIDALPLVEQLGLLSDRCGKDLSGDRAI